MQLQMHVKIDKLSLTLWLKFWVYRCRCFPQ